ncbi:unnamed protein product [Parnassius apollo]|uniref:(apollo) hypothetical protein n=1 Tax=Parnassius apollo TaxID=110799 RepID=A0A8S3XJN4_PARAO|nr:unnamed protein product [Parnassius apollo]
MVSAIPDRWLQYKACGKVIEGTRIICFKVPLKRVVQIKHRDVNELWDIKAVLKKIPKLGAVVDLTNTTRYYDPKKFEMAGMRYKKILMPGRIIPPEDKVTEFMNAVDTFLEDNDDKLVGVHCTHGLNRTGYMVCRYMRDRLGVPAAVAIRRFELARGYQIERDNYVADLLGKRPPSPDIGLETTIKPIAQKDKSKNWKVSRFDQKAYDGEETKFYKRKFNRERSEEESRRGKRRRNRSSSDYSDRSFDYKFDY